MFRKMLALVLLGILVVGVGTIAYGTYFDKGFAASVASVTGGGEGEAGEEGRTGKHRGEDEDDDDD